jgi:hypothetical protein
VDRAIPVDLASASASHLPTTLSLLPIAGPLVYPLLLNSYSAVAHAADNSAAYLQRIPLFTAALALMLAASTIPWLALRSLLRLDESHRVDMRFLRRVLHIAAATPPVYVLAVELTTALGISEYVNALWSGAWILIAAAIWRPSAADGCANSRTHSIIDRSVPIFRVAHGVATLTLLLVFLVPHLANHLAALWTVGTHQAVMKLLRLWYRATWVEPIVLGLGYAITATGLVLLAFHTRTAGGRYRTVQTASGAYLAAFMLAHTNAILWGRSVHLETDWLFASGGPTGLLLGTAYYLIPYYTFAVIAVFVHVALGLRIILLAHQFKPAAVARALYAISALGVVAGVFITIALLGVHVAG